MPRRMLDYFTRLALRETWPVDIHQVLIQFTGPPMPTGVTIGDLTLTWHLLHVPSTPAATFLAQPGLSALAAGAADPPSWDVVADAVIADATQRRDAGDSDGAISMLQLSTWLAPAMTDTLIERLKEAHVSDLMDRITHELFQTDLGRSVLADAEAAGRLAMLQAVLQARFPDAPAEQVTATAARLATDPDPAATAVAAQSLTGLDPLPAGPSASTPRVSPQRPTTQARRPQRDAGHLER
jgi:hypothetical protein